MNNLKLIILPFIVLFSSNELIARQGNYESLFEKRDSIQKKEISFYAGLIHQHENFFGKAFSFQGIEAGVIANNKWLSGVYASTFVSNLKVDINQTPKLVFISQGGLFIGRIWHEEKKIHAGVLMNVGYFSLKADDSGVGSFSSDNQCIKLHGVVINPWIFAELNLPKWMKLRTGLGYGFYGFKYSDFMTNKDLNNIAFSFGFIFGKF